MNPFRQIPAEHGGCSSWWRRYCFMCDTAYPRVVRHQHGRRLDPAERFELGMEQLTRGIREGETVVAGRLGWPDADQADRWWHIPEDMLARDYLVESLKAGSLL